MKNSMISLIVLVLAFSGSLFANKNRTPVNIYAQHADGNYLLMSSYDFFPVLCLSRNEEICAYIVIKDKYNLPKILTTEQVLELSDPIYGPIELEAMVDTFQLPIKGYYYFDLH
ncbi:hypothetical protein [Pedobacter gandavensis]|uniref:hypothetical protein n=1 Tax=Pedobacter gandavensis TaxID=2679963 RepID=UPI00293164D3|nr:hypothetical protein [Pedobacter gandavensis]